METKPTATGGQVNSIDKTSVEHRRAFASLSIKYRLPLLIGVLLSFVLVVFTWASYRAMKESSEDLGRDRLSQLTTYLAVQLHQQIAGLATRTETAANDPAIRNFLRSPTQKSRDDAMTNVKQLLSSADQTNLQVEIWNNKSERVLVEPQVTVDSSPELSDDFKKSSAPPFKAVGAIQIVNGTPAFPIVAAIRDEAGNILGYVVRWRKLTANPQGRQQIMDIVGNGAQMYLGNASGNLWTDLVKVAPNPPATVDALAKGIEYQRDGQPMMALSRPIPETPWFVLIEFATGPLLAPANKFLRRTIIISIVLLIVGVAASIVVSRNITRPLSSITNAAAAISAGDYSQRVGIHRHDELGELAAAFNVMVSKIREAQRELGYKASLFNHTYDAVFVWDWNEKITFWNRGAQRLYGYTESEALGRKPVELLKTRLRPGTTEYVGALETNGLWEGELDHTTSDGRRIIVDSRMAVIHQGERISVVEVTRDVTERRRAEDQLRLQSAALESAANAIMITDSSGKTLWVNPAFTASTGYRAEEVIGRNPRLLKSGEQDDAFYQDMWQTITSGKVWRDTVVNRRKDGTLNREDMTITPIRDSAGRISHFVAIKQDITELQNLLSQVTAKNDELAKMTQQLWQASRLATVGELAASIAHELNNPLATVSLKLETLAGQLDNDTEKLRSVEIVADEVERMGKLVGNLLQFSRRTHQQSSTVNVSEEIDKSLELVEYHLRSNKIQVIRNYAEDVPTIQADRQQLRQVFLNLLTNASDAIKGGGTLTVSVKRANDGATPRMIRVEFIDSGAGIEPANLEKIWDPFFTTKPEGKGTGLGLAICRRVIEEHHGSIAIESEIGRGTKITIDLPATNGDDEDNVTPLPASTRNV